MSVASSGARGLKAKFESMAEEKRKQEEEEKAQQMARQQQERKALVKMSHEAQQPVATRKEPAVPAPLPKIQTKSEGLEKNISRKRRPKESRSRNTHIR